MKKNILTIQIDKPIDEVFKFTINPKNTHKWVESIEEEWVDRWPISLGSKYYNTNKYGETTEYTVSDYINNSIFELTPKDGSYRVRYTYRQLDNGGTELEYSESVEDGELENPFTQEILEGLKKLIED